MTTATGPAKLSVRAEHGGLRWSWRCSLCGAVVVIHSTTWEAVGDVLRRFVHRHAQQAIGCRGAAVLEANGAMLDAAGWG